MSFHVIFYSSLVYSSHFLLSRFWPFLRNASFFLSIAYATLLFFFAGSFSCDLVIVNYGEYDFSRYFCLDGPDFFFGIPFAHIFLSSFLATRFSFLLFIVLILSLCFTIACRLRTLRQSSSAPALSMRGRLSGVVESIFLFSSFIVSPFGQYGVLNFSAQFLAFVLSLCVLFLIRDKASLVVCSLLAFLSVFIHSSSILLFLAFFAKDAVVLAFASLKALFLRCSLNTRLASLSVGFFLASPFCFLLFQYLFAPYQYLLDLGVSSSSSDAVLYGRPLFLVSGSFVCIGFLGQVTPFLNSRRNVLPSRVAAVILRLVLAVFAILAFFILFVRVVPLLALRTLFYADWVMVGCFVFLVLASPLSPRTGRPIPQAFFGFSRIPLLLHPYTLYFAWLLACLLYYVLASSPSMIQIMSIFSGG